MDVAYKRVLLKVSGESLQGKGNYGFSHERILAIAREIKEIRELGVEVAVVVGGGNIFRGQSGMLVGFDRVSGDTIGMLATIVNTLAMASTFKEVDLETKIFTSIPMPRIAELYTPEKAVEKLKEGKIVIIGGGSGNAFFTTDTAGVLRALQLSCDIVLKGTRVDGVYSKDPEKYDDAEFYPELSYQKVLDDKLRVMDSTSFTLCQENKLPIIVFNFEVKGNLKRIVTGEKIGTLVRN